MIDRIGIPVALHFANWFMEADAMTPTRDWIEDMVMRIQNAFLDAPTLTLTPLQAARRFGVDLSAGKAILDALADNGVLSREVDGRYLRRIPRLNSAAVRHFPVTADVDDGARSPQAA